MSFYDEWASLDSSRWTAVTVGSGTVTAADNLLEFNTPANADVAYIYYNTKIDKTKDQLWVFSGMQVSGTNNFFAYLSNSVSAPASGTFSDAAMRVRFATSDTGTRLRFAYWTGAHARMEWQESAPAWQAAATTLAVDPIMVNDFTQFALEIDGVAGRFRCLAWGRRGSASSDKNQGYKLQACSDWIAWTALEATGDLWLVSGDQFTNVGAGVTQMDAVRMIEGPKRHGWVNQSDDIGDPYRVKHLYTYGVDPYAVWVPEDRTTLAVDVGAGGTWEDAGVKDPSIVRDDNDTYYLAYDGNDGSVLQVGMASRAGPDGAFTKYGSNPIIVSSAGNEAQVSAPRLVKDVSEPDASRRWKIFYVGVSATPNWRIYWAYAATPLSTWTKGGSILLDVGSGGAFDEMGCNRPVLLLYGGTWYLFYGGKPASGTPAFGRWEVSYATSPTLLNGGTWTKSGVVLMGYSQASDARQALSANLTARTASMTDTTGFLRDMYVMVDDDTTTANWGCSRVRKVTTNTSLELRHSLQSFTTANSAEVWGMHTGSIDCTGVLWTGTEWQFLVTLSQADAPATPKGFMESTGLFRHALAGPVESTPLIDWQGTPPIPLHKYGGRQSCENVSLAMSPQGVAGFHRIRTRPFPFRPSSPRGRM